MKKTILSFIRKSTEKAVQHSFYQEDGVETVEIMKLLSLERSSASRYLNQLVKDGSLIKINSRPVVFFHKLVLEEFFLTTLNTNTYHQFSDLQKEIHNTDQTNNNVFINFIGWDRSLSQQVEQCRAAICYPPKGLPMLLTGESGVGKSFLANLIYQHAVSQQVIESDAPFITLNCAEYSDNPELVTAKLFGYKKGAFTGADNDQKGVIEQANGGVLFLDEAHRLTPAGQEKLFLFMDKGIFHRLGESDKWNESSVRLIFATTEDPRNAFLTTFLRRIPITVELPALFERSDYEKYRMITYFYQSESKEIGLDISLHSNVLEFLMDGNREGNVGALKNLIRYSCAQAYSEVFSKRMEKVEISLRHFPISEVQNNMKYQLSYKKTIFVDHLIPITSEGMLNPDPYTKYFRGDLEDLYYNLIQKLKESIESGENERLFLNRTSVYVNDYIDKLVFSSESKNNQLEFSVIHRLVKQFITIQMENELPSEIFSEISGNTIIAVTHFIYHSSNQRIEVNTNESIQVYEIIIKHYNRERKLIEMMTDKLKNTFNFHFSILDICILVLFISNVREKPYNNQIQSLIVAHGFSTASSIANITNRLLGKNVFKSFDMPLQVETKQIVHQLNEYLDQVNTDQGVLILVDMGSLIDVQKELRCLDLCSVAVVNNITTQLAIDAGEKILKGFSINQIVEEVTHSHNPQYKLFHPRLEERPKAIVTTCLTGIGTATKIKELLDKSIDERDIHVIAYDFGSLTKNQKEESIFKNYNVLCIVGTANPEIENIPYLALEEIISEHMEDHLIKVLQSTLGEDSIQKINNNIIKHFSLQSVLNHLTILNPNQLLEHISEAVERLQRALGTNFSSTTRISMYVHLCCLTERLVTHRPIESYPDIQYFRDSNEEFIDVVYKAFTSLEKTYSVTIPLTEVGYIFDMIRMKV